MKSKLNLTIEESLINIAREKAKELGISISQLFEMYLKEFTTKKNVKPSDFIKRLQLDDIQVPDDYDYKKDLPEILKKKYVEDRD